MKLIILAAMTAAVSTGAIAQHAQNGSHNPVVKDSHVRAVAAPARGHSSFTENQAKGRIAKAGFTRIGELRKTNAGGWQGHAMRNRRDVMVTLDYKGDVTAR